MCWCFVMLRDRDVNGSTTVLSTDVFVPVSEQPPGEHAHWKKVTSFHFYGLLHRDIWAAQQEAKRTNTWKEFRLTANRSSRLKAQLRLQKTGFWAALAAIEPVCGCRYEVLLRMFYVDCHCSNAATCCAGVFKSSSKPTQWVKCLWCISLHIILCLPQIKV